MRVITRTGAMAAPTYYFVSMKSGAEAGLAPLIYYLNAEDSISITDFIDEQPFLAHEARIKMAGLLHGLHSLKKFSFRINYFNAMERFIVKFNAASILPFNETKKFSICIND